MDILDNIPVLREDNRRLVLSLIRDKPISRAALARKTGLHPSTITRIVAALIEAGLVREEGEGENELGRKPILLSLAPDAIYVLGISIESTFVSGLLLNLEARIIEKKKAEFGDADMETVMGETYSVLDHLLKRAAERKIAVAGIGVAMHGVVDSKKGICVFSPSSGAKNVAVAERIRKRYSLPVRVDNNAKAMVLGEFWFGNGKGVDNLLAVKIGHTIGSGIILNGHLYSGTNYSAGEIGHLSVVFDGLQCKCGNYGCLETVASLGAIIKRGRLLLKQKEGSDLLEFIGSNPHDLNFESLCFAAESGQRLALQLWEEAGNYLGLALANTINILNPTKVLLGGDILPALDFILPKIRDIVEARSFKTIKTTTIIEEAGLGFDAVSVGAATLVFKDIFKP